jgi:hypothetical protein
MQPVRFDRQNIVFAESQPQYLPLPAWRGPPPDGAVVSCWELSWCERLEVLLLGKIWLKLLTFGTPLQPSRLSTTWPERAGPEEG